MLIPLAILAGGLHANLIQNGSFESNPIVGETVVYASGDSTSLPGWMITGSTCGSNCVEGMATTYTEGSLTFEAEDGLQSVDLTGLGNHGDGGVQQTVTGLTPGESYTLTFWLGNQDDSSPDYPLPSALVAFVNGVSQGAFSNNFNFPNRIFWQEMSFSFAAPSSTVVIGFRNATGSTDNYAGLDNVSLEPTIPEPATFLMLVGGAALMLLIGRRLPAVANACTREE
jgi:hypothetical protein